MPDTFGMVINGREVPALSGKTFSVQNPANTDEVVGVVPQGDREDVRRAVDAAEAAIAGSWWARLHESRRRGKVLRGFIDLVEAHKDQLARLLTREQGKIVKESIAELDSLINTFDYYAGYGGKLTGTVTYVREGDNVLKVETRKEPIGLCGAILPFNFPVSLCAWKVAPALIAGNAVIIKPASTAPLTNIRLAMLFQEAGLPPGIVNVVTGPANVVGDELVRHPAIRRIALTGSTETGKRIYAAAAEGLKHVTLELGGNDPTVVCDDADLAVAAQTIVRSGRFRNAGQSCTSVKRVYIFENIFEEFSKRVGDEVRQMKVGNGLEPSTDMGPLNNAQVRNDVEKLLHDALTRGAVLFAGGARPSGQGYERGYFFEPTILLDVPAEAKIWEEECFGPVLPLMRVHDLDDAITQANASPYGLGAAIWSANDHRIEQFIAQIHAGIVWVNYKPASVPEAPFGGMKESGIGRELGAEGLAEYLETKSIRKFVGKADEAR